MHQIRPPCSRPPTSLYFALLLCAWALAPRALTAGPAPIPVLEFFERASFYAPSLSPDGKKLAYLTLTTPEQSSLNVLDLQTLRATTFDTRGEDIYDYDWLPWPDQNIELQSRTLPGHIPHTSIFSPAQKKSLHRVTYADLHFGVISRVRSKPNHYYVFFYADYGTGLGHVERGVAVIDASRRPESNSHKNNSRFNVVSWLDLPTGEYHRAKADANGELRCVLMYLDGKLSWYYRRNTQSPWKKLSLDYNDAEETIVSIEPESDILYVTRLEKGAPTHALFRYDAATDQILDRVFAHEKFSMNSASMLRMFKTHTVVGFRYSGDRTETVWFESTLRSIQQIADKQLPGRHNTITDWNDDLSYAVVASDLDGSAPSRYYLYDRAKQKLSALEANWTRIPENQRYRTKAFGYVARDGLALRGYLTLPAPRPDGSKPPLVVLPHGGPWVRDTGDYDPEVQLLASRGYAVVQPNYRGSTGYARAVSIDPEFDFRAMHNDVTDATKAIISSDLVDPKRVAIMGASFGGYLSVCGVAYEPDLYKCAVALVGVYDWAKMTKYTAGDRYDKFNYDLLLQRLGDPVKNAERYRKISPIHDVAQIKVPVFVSYGFNDYTADYKQSTELIKEFKKNNVPHEVLGYDNEGHGVAEREHRKELYEAIERFLAKNL